MRRAAAAPTLLVLAATGAAAQDGTPVLRTLQDVSRAVRDCWVLPSALRRMERLDVTVRFSLRSDGSVIGGGRVAFADAPPEASVRALLTQSATEAVVTCSPFRLDRALGAAIAGRLFAVRLLYRGPKGQGV